MAWNGWYQLGGNEIINATRTEQYLANAGMNWFTPAYDNDSLAYMVDGIEAYNTPLMDDAPWTDPDYPASYEFFGYYPLDVSGIESSTRQSTVVESTKDGGLAGRLRNATKSVVFNGILVASSEEGAEYGMQWLKRALLASPCDDGTANCGGADLCFFSSEPTMQTPKGDGYSYVGGELVYVGAPYVDPSACLQPYERTLRKFVVNNGPNITAKKELSDGSAMWMVTFTGVAGTPFEFGSLVPIIEGFMDPSVTDPFVPGVTGGTYDLNGIISTDANCAVAEWEPLYDPLCPAMVPPPAPPDIPLGCYTAPANWKRRQITIPKAYIPLWGDAVPVIEVHARGGDLRDLRLRFYADVAGTGDPNADNCAYCGDIVISYVPRDTTLVFDAASQTIYVQDPGGRTRRADSLVFDTDGKPFDWPSLSCGFGYIVTFDLPQTQAAPVVDLGLIARSA